MKYEVGQLIIGRFVGRFDKGKIEDFRITKVGKKYIYVVPLDLPSSYAIPLLKDTLANKEDWRNSDWQYFHSYDAMKEYDEEIRLFYEVREMINHTSGKRLGLKKLREIRALLEVDDR